MLVQWQNEKHSLGIEVIDSQHKELFILINKLNSLIEKKDYDLEHKQREAASIIKNLYNYSSYHFLSEEELFAQHGYPEADSHRNKHDKFREIIKNYLEDIRTTPNLSLEYLQDFLVEWIIEHIQQDDHAYAYYFTEHGIKPEIQISDKGKQRNNILRLWEQKKLSLEILEIDEQHREIVRILQQTNDLQYVSEKRKLIFVPIIIRKLFYYAQFHFAYEEEFLAKNQYRSIDEQIEQHKTFVADINKFYEEYQSGLSLLTDKIIFFLRDWIVEHILKEDKKYKEELLL